VIEGVFRWLDAFRRSNLAGEAFGEPHLDAGKTIIPVYDVRANLQAEGNEDQVELRLPAEWPRGAGRSRLVALISVGDKDVQVQRANHRTAAALIGACLFVAGAALSLRWWRRPAPPHGPAGRPD